MLKLGIFGAGHLGKIHIKLAKMIDTIDLVGFYDANPDVAKQVESDLEIKAFYSVDSLLENVDAVDIVTPTISHFELAKQAVISGKHVFVEKPLTQTLEEGKELIRLQKEHKVKFQVGHVERFNPAYLALENHDLSPMFIEGHRLAQWNPRGTDVSVVLDLMIHDIDVVLHMVNSPVTDVYASGVSVISDTLDIANARVQFENGCVANLTASRISLKNMRKMRVFQRNTYLSMDFLDKKTELFNISDNNEDNIETAFTFNINEKEKVLTYQELPTEPVNAIKMELETFAKSIENNSETRVTLEQAYNNLELAHLIMEKLNIGVQNVK